MTHDKPDTGEMILLVEDEPPIRVLMRRLLEGAGYRIVETRNAHEALSKARQHAGELGLLVTDIVMPDMDGFALERRLSSEYPHLEVLFLSGHAVDSVAVRGGLKESGKDFLLKSFSPQALLEKVQMVLRRHGQA